MPFGRDMPYGRDGLRPINPNLKTLYHISGFTRYPLWLTPTISFLPPMA